MAQLSIIIAFVAGIISFLSPCVLPLIPAFLGYLAGTGTSSRAHMFLNSVMYVLGFSIVFALLGILLNTVLAHAAYGVQLWLGRIGGIIIIIFGLHH
jgi:cytochrome c-type biogenesis protein